MSTNCATCGVTNQQAALTIMWILRGIALCHHCYDIFRYNNHTIGVYSY